MKRLTLQLKLLFITGMLVIASVIGMSGKAPTQAATIGELQNKASELQDEINEANKKAEVLAEKAKTLENTIESLDVRIEQAQRQIKLTNLKIAKLEKELEQTQAELDRQKELLAANMKALYKRGGASPVELLIASDSFSEFIDEQEYLERLKAGIQESAEKVVELKFKIQAQKEEQEDLLDEQKLAKRSLDESRQQRATLLVETKGDEARFRAYSRNLAEKQRDINRQLLRLSRLVSSGGSGGYPWSNALCVWTGSPTGLCRHPNNSNYDYEWYVGSKNNRRDPWNYFYRNCTSYVAYRSAQKGLEVSGLGNGGQWANNSWKYSELSTGSQPKKGSFAVFESASFGHVAYVEDVVGNEVLVSEYNFVADGVYSERWIPKSQPSSYVYTPWSK